MHYLSAYDRSLFKSYYWYVSILPFEKSFNFMKNIFNYISIYSLKEILVNEDKTQMRYKKNKFLFSWRYEKSGVEPGIFEGRGGFCKLEHKFLAVLKVKVKCKH